MQAKYKSDNEAAAKENKPQAHPYPWMGLEWFDLQERVQTLNQFVIDGLLVTGGARDTFKSNSSHTYKLANPELVRECLEAIKMSEQGTEEGEIPTDLFDFIIGHDDIKDLFWRALRAPLPVHILLVGPPATAKTMFLSEASRLPFSRFTNGSTTTKAGLSDFLLEFRPKYLIIDEIDKMSMDDMSVLLSLMESGTVTRLKKRMRESEQMMTWVFAGANRAEHIWPELRIRFFEKSLDEYSEQDYITIATQVLIRREKCDPAVAASIAHECAMHTRDVREAVRFGRLCKTLEDVPAVVKIKWPERRLF
jgi:Holliday junction DNA helicase RuvB